MYRWLRVSTSELSYQLMKLGDVRCSFLVRGSAIGVTRHAVRVRGSLTSSSGEKNDDRRRAGWEMNSRSREQLGGGEAGPRLVERPRKTGRQ